MSQVAIACLTTVAMTVFLLRGTRTNARLLRVTARASSQPGDDALSAVYANIRAKADSAADTWPHAQDLLSKCAADEDGYPRPPAFEDGHGPIGAYAFLRTDGNLECLRWARGAFVEVTKELASALTAVQRRSFRRRLWIAEERSWHTCVAVFHEHPSLLSAEDRVRWRPVNGTLATELATTLRMATQPLRAPVLTLDSLSICTDGAMIAGFVDNAGDFTELRRASVAAGRAGLQGELTSRPKALIHVTLGRLLGAPGSLSASQRDSWASTIRRFNAAGLPRLGTEAHTAPRFNLGDFPCLQLPSALIESCTVCAAGWTGTGHARLAYPLRGCRLRATRCGG